MPNLPYGTEHTYYRALDETLISFTHPSGLRVYIVPKKGYTKKFAEFAVDFGSVDTCFRLPGAQTPVRTPQGVAHFLEHKLFEQENGNVMEQYARLGASPNAETGYSQTAYHFTCTDRFGDCLRLLLHYVLHPYLTPENVEKEKGIIAQEIGMYADDPYSVCLLELMRLLYVHTPVRNDIAGTVEDIRSLTPELLYTCHRAFYYPANMVLTVVGDVDPEQVAQLVAEAELPEPAEGGAQHIREPEPDGLAGHTYTGRMEVALPLFYFGWKDRAAAFAGMARVRRDLAGTILKDMLFGRQTAFYETLYEKGLIHSAFGASYEIERDYAMASLFGESEQPLAVRTCVEEYLRGLQRSGLPREEFETVRASVAGRMLKRLNTPEAIGSVLCGAALQGIDAFDYYAACETVTFEEAEAVFHEVFLGEMAASVIEKG